MSVSNFYAPPDGVSSRARSATRDSRKQVSIPGVSKWAPPSTRRAVHSMDKRDKDGILSHTDPKHDMPEDADTPTDA